MRGGGQVDLVFRQQRLQLRPAMEEIRAKYYRELKKFIQIPERFGGLSNDASLFATIIDRTAASFATVYRKVRVSCLVLAALPFSSNRPS